MADAYAALYDIHAYIGFWVKKCVFNLADVVALSLVASGIVDVIYYHLEKQLARIIALASK